MLASFLIFNLFIGIVLNSMEEARSADRKEHETDDLLARLSGRTYRVGRGRSPNWRKRTGGRSGMGLTSSIVEVLRWPGAG